MIITQHDRETHSQEALEEAELWTEVFGRFVPLTIFTGLGVMVGLYKIYPQAPMWLVIGTILIVSFPVGTLLTAILNKIRPVKLEWRD